MQASPSSSLFTSRLYRAAGWADIPNLFVILCLPGRPGPLFKLVLVPPQGHRLLSALEFVLDLFALVLLKFLHVHFYSFQLTQRCYLIQIQIVARCQELLFLFLSVSQSQVYWWSVRIHVNYLPRWFFLWYDFNAWVDWHWLVRSVGYVLRRFFVLVVLTQRLTTVKALDHVTLLLTMNLVLLVSRLFFVTGDGAVGILRKFLATHVIAIIVLYDFVWAIWRWIERSKMLISVVPRRFLLVKEATFFAIARQAGQIFLKLVLSVLVHLFACLRCLAILFVVLFFIQDNV